MGVEGQGWPLCQRCQVGRLLPLSDYGTDGAAVRYKAWACTSPTCGYVLRIDKGVVGHGRVREEGKLSPGRPGSY